MSGVDLANLLPMNSASTTICSGRLVPLTTLAASVHRANVYLFFPYSLIPQMIPVRSNLMRLRLLILYPFAALSLSGCDHARQVSAVSRPAPSVQMRESEVMPALNFASYVTDNYLRSTTKTKRCERHVRPVKGVSVFAELPDGSGFEIEAEPRLDSEELHYVEIRRGGPGHGLVIARLFFESDTVRVSRTISAADRNPSVLSFPVSGPIGQRLDHLGKLALSMTCS